METSKQLIPAVDKIPYPSHPVMKYLFKSPIFFWRLGFGSYVGKLFMIMTTYGRKSGLLRRTAIEYHRFGGRKYVMAAWPHSDWYRNLQVNPNLTIQTAQGTERVKARRLVEDDELAAVFDFVETDPAMQRFWQMLGFKLTREEFIRQKEQFHMLTFDPIEDPTPPPLEADLTWLLPLLLATLALGWVLGWLFGRDR